MFDRLLMLQVNLSVVDINHPQTKQQNCYRREDQGNKGLFSSPLTTDKQHCAWPRLLHVHN